MKETIIPFGYRVADYLMPRICCLTEQRCLSIIFMVNSVIGNGQPDIAQLC